MLNKHSWNWFYHNVIEEAKCFYGIELKFIYCGVIITDVYSNKRLALKVMTSLNYLIQFRCI